MVFRVSTGWPPVSVTQMKNIIIKGSYVWAAGIAILLALWILSGYVGADEQAEAQNDTNLSSVQDIQKVRAVSSTARRYAAAVTVRGRTEASRSVTVRAETVGRVTSVSDSEGKIVKAGDVLCELALDDREAKRVEAEAKTKQALIEYEAAKKLMAKGYRSETQEAAAEAAYTAAQAVSEQIALDIERTKMRAPFDGVFDERSVEVGDYVRPGDSCGTVVDHEPMFVVGRVSEREVMKIEVGSIGEAQLFSGEKIEGKVRFISVRADEATRTFRVEVELPNPDASIREGITAITRIATEPVLAHRISPAILTLNDQGQMGVKVLDEKNVVSFRAIEIVSDQSAGVWVTGLDKQSTIITVGQEYVRDGEKVDVTIENFEPQTMSKSES